MTCPAGMPVVSVFDLQAAPIRTAANNKALATKDFFISPPTVVPVIVSARIFTDMTSLLSGHIIKCLSFSPAIGIKSPMDTLQPRLSASPHTSRLVCEQTHYGLIGFRSGMRGREDKRAANQVFRVENKRGETTQFLRPAAASVHSAEV